MYEGPHAQNSCPATAEPLDFRCRELITSADWYISKAVILCYFDDDYPSDKRDPTLRRSPRSPLIGSHLCSDQPGPARQHHYSYRVKRFGIQTYLT